MKKIIQSIVLAFATAVLFSCGHMNYNDHKDGAKEQGCACESEKSEAKKTDATKEVCGHCKKGS